MPSNARTYSERLGALSDGQLQAALDRFDLGRLLRAEPAATGLFGQNVFLTTTSGEFVLRGAGLLQQFQKEQFFTKLIHERTDVPAAWPYLLEASEEVFGWPYAVMPRLPGIDVGSPDVRKTFTREDRVGLARAMGDALARLHALTWDHYGDYDAHTGSIARAEGPFAEWLVARVRMWVERCRDASAATTDDDAAWVESVIEAARDALGEPAPTFAYTDYKENNTVAVRTEGGWRVTGVFDLGEGYFGDGDADFSRSMAGYMRGDAAYAQAFLDGYRARRTLRAGFEVRFPLYMLLDRLIIWQYGQRNKLWFEEGVTLRDWAEPFTSFRPEGVE